MLFVNIQMYKKKITKKKNNKRNIFKLQSKREFESDYKDDKTDLKADS